MTLNDPFLPITKSFLANWELCPLKAFWHKVDRIKSVSSDAGTIGIKVHEWRGKIVNMQIDYHEALEAIWETEPEHLRGEIRDLVKLAVETDPFNSLTTDERASRVIEKYFAVSPQGKLLKSQKGAILHGFIDDIFLGQNGSVVLLDLKTGRSISDDRKERHFYVCGAHAMYPDRKEFIFKRHWVRYGESPSWHYIFSEDNSELTEITPAGSKIIHRPHNGDVLLHFVHDQIRIVREAGEPQAKPGPHCESWYGEPCQFLGKECPEGKDIPEVINALVPVVDDESVVATDAMSILAAIVNGDLIITPETAAWAFSGLMQMKGFLAKVEKALKNWSRENGPIVIGGDAPYGWFTVPETVVDAPFVLREMLRAGLTEEEICRVINMSKSSLNKLSKRKYPELRQTIQSLGMSDGTSKPKFGLIKPGEEEAGDGESGN